MITFIKVQNYKGINDLTLANLGHINVICGKNNSGKSSVLEAIMLKEICNLGRQIRQEDIQMLIRTFETVANRYDTPNPESLKRWFRDFIKSQVDTVIYNKNVGQYVAQYTEDYNKSAGTKYSPLANFNGLFLKFLDEQSDPFRPFLIPPKRKLEYEIEIDTKADPAMTGENLLNLLFYLKNQDPHSKDSKTYEEIYNIFSDITGGHYFNIVPGKNNKISLVFTTDPTDSHWINAVDSGLGLREILMIISFILAFEYNFIMIEEPENHIHPDMQRKLMSFLQAREKQQFLLATHSNIFLDPSFVDKIYRTSFNVSVELTDNTNRANILSDLGYSVSDNLVSDLIILVEGPTDGPFIEEICKKIGFWDNYNIKFWPMGGDIMSQLDLSTLIDNITENRIIALIDSDTESKKERNRFKENCEKMKIECVQLKRYAIENYIPLEIMRNFSEFKLPADIQEIKPNEKVERQIGINLKKNLRKLAKTMEIKDVEHTDLFDFCKKVEKIVNNV